MQVTRGRPRSIPRLWPLGPALIAFAVYRATLAPDLTWAHNGADGGDLLTAALTGGVPHPPGYPTYMLLLRGMLALPGGPPAFLGNLFSALTTSLALVFIALAGERALREARAPQAIARPLAAIVALLIGFAPTLWSQAVITEVYGLHALFTAALIYLTLRLGGDVVHGRQGLATGLLFGLGLGNHLSLALLIPGMLAYTRLSRTRLTRRALMGLLIGCAIGLLTYLYLPWAAHRNPPVNWGNPRDLPRLWWLVSGQAYRPLVFAFPLAWLPWRLSGWAALLLQNLTLPGLALALFGLWWAEANHRGLLSMTILHVAVFSVYALGYSTADSYVYLSPVYLALAPAIALGAWVTGTEAIQWVRARWPGRSRAAAGALLLALALLPAGQVWMHWKAEDLGEDREAVDFGREALATARDDALIITATDQPTFSLWYFRYGLGLRPDVAILNANLYAFDWYRETVARWHPDVVLVGGRSTPPDFSALVDENMRVRPVYLAELMVDPLTRYSAIRKGPLYLLKPHTP